MALSVIATVFLLVGLGFLSVALWIIVAAEHGTLIAFEVMGGLYVVLGLICLLLRPSTDTAEGQYDQTSAEQTAARATEDPWTRIATGFAAGLQAGRAARDSRD